MSKIEYRAPEVRKVKLQVKNAILAVCHTSPTQTPRGPGSLPGATPCNITPGCFTGPGG